MSFTYGGDPSLSPLERIRFEIGDTDEEYPIFQDAEIQYCIAVETDELSAAAHCCEIIARKLAKEPDTAIGRTRVSGSAAAEHFAKLAKELRIRVATSNIGFPVGNLVPPLFSRGMHDA